MNHKRHRPKNRRAGCLLCKPHKANGAKNRDPVAARRAAPPSPAAQVGKRYVDPDSGEVFEEPTFRYLTKDFL